MKHVITLSLLIGLSASGAVLAQQGDMTKDVHKNMSMDMHNDIAMDMNKGSTQSMNSGTSAERQAVHHASGTVKSIDREKGIVTLAHGPVKTLNWPGMTMGFGVRDKAMLEQLEAGDKVDVELVKEGPKYVITAVK